MTATTSVTEFATVLRHAIRNAVHGAGVTRQFFQLAKLTPDWAVIEPRLLEVEAAYKAAGGKGLPQVWRNAKSVIKAGCALEVELSDGHKTNALVIAESFNGLKDKIKEADTLAKKAAMQAAAEKMADKAESAQGDDTTVADSVAPHMPEALANFMQTLLADNAMMTAFLDQADTILSDLADMAGAIEANRLENLIQSERAVVSH